MLSASTRRALLVTLLSVYVGAAAADSSKGTFGFVAKIDADGLFNPTLKTVVIQSVQAGFPAAHAGVVAGDSIIEVEGTQVSGAKATVMADRMKKRPGDTIVLKLVRAGGEAYVVTLTAIESKN